MKAVLLVLALLAASPSAAADWLQEGYDPAQTGRTPEPGPEWNDVALDVQLPAVAYGFYRVQIPPIIVGETAYVLTNTVDANEYICSRRATFELWAQPLDGAPHKSLGQFATSYCAWPSLASDGSHVFVAANDRIAAYSIAQADWAWDEPNHYQVRPDLLPAQEPPDVPGSGSDWYQRCDSMVVDAGRVVVACHWVTADRGLAALFVSAFNATTGAPAGGPWSYDGHTASLEEWAATQPDNDMPYQSIPDGFETFVAGLAVADGVAVVVTNLYAVTGLNEHGLGHQARFNRIWAVDLDSGVGLWHRSLGDGVRSLDKEAEGALPQAAPPWIHGTAVYAKGQFLVKANLEDGSAWTAAPDLRTEFLDSDAGSGCASLGEDMVCAFAGRAYRLAADFSVRWHTDLAQGERWAHGGLVAAGGRILGITEAIPATWAAAPPSGSKVVALDERTGDLLWSHTLKEGGWTGRIAVSGEAAVILQPSGRLTVLGTTAASPVLTADMAGMYPATSSLFEVRLAATGGLGSAWEYRVDWGDGTIAPWQADATFQHRYGEGEDRHARFFVRNDAGQTASIPMTFYVGKADPAVSIFNSPFSDKYQETTFFLLGLLLTGIVALIGIYRAGRKRRRFEVELRRLEADHAALGDDPTACDSMLGEARRRARELFLRKHLEEAHASFLERRVDEMRQGLRLSAVDEKLKFLPHGMVQHLRRLLNDGRIDVWERSHFLDALEREKDLNKGQRMQVRRLIDDWFEKDSGGRA